MGNSTLPTVCDKLNVTSTIHLRKLISILAAALRIGLGFVIASRRHEEEKHHWHIIHMHKKHEILRGLKLIHHGLFDLTHHDKQDGRMSEHSKPSCQ
jgi:hypothetical protein